MKEQRLNIPEGYWEASLEETLRRTRVIRKRRRSVLGAALALLLIAGFTWTGPLQRPSEQEMIAEVTELSELDVFLMINGE